MPYAEEKKTELIRIAKGALPLVENQEKISSFVIEYFTRVSDPEGDNYMEMIVLGSNSGLGGGRSKKPGNILLNWKRLLVDGGEHYLTVVGAVANSYLIPLAALVVWNKIWALTKVEISENHAMVISALWDIRDKNNCVDGSNLTENVNAHFRKHTKRELSENEVDRIIGDLSDLRAIKLQSDGKIWLRESVQQPY